MDQSGWLSAKVFREDPGEVKIGTNPWGSSFLKYHLLSPVSLAPLGSVPVHQTLQFRFWDLQRWGRADTRGWTFRNGNTPNTWIWEAEGKVLNNGLKVRYGTYRTARRFLSDIGASIPPTPSAAFPRRGKKPCKPRIAIMRKRIQRMAMDGQRRSDTSSNTPSRLP